MRENPAGVVQAGWKESRTTPGKITSRKSSSCCPLHELSLLGRTQEGLFLKSLQHMAAALPGASAAHQEGTGKHQCPHLLPGGAPRTACAPQTQHSLWGRWAVAALAPNSCPAHSGVQGSMEVSPGQGHSSHKCHPPAAGAARGMSLWLCPSPGAAHTAQAPSPLTLLCLGGNPASPSRLPTSTFLVPSVELSPPVGAGPAADTFPWPLTAPGLSPVPAHPREEEL